MNAPHPSPRRRGPPLSNASAATAPAVTLPNLAAGANIPPHMIATVRNNQLPSAELAERLGVTVADIDAVRSLGPYDGSTWLRAEQAALKL